MYLASPRTPRCSPAEISALAPSACHPHRRGYRAGSGPTGPPPPRRSARLDPSPIELALPRPPPPKARVTSGSPVRPGRKAGESIALSRPRLRSRLARRPVTSLASHIHEPEQCRREWEDPQRPKCPRAAGAHTVARNDHASIEPHRESPAEDSVDPHTVYVDTGTEKMTHVAVD
jgi:hypothetical protein